MSSEKQVIDQESMKALVAFLPDLEDPNCSFGEWYAPEPRDDGVKYFPYFVFNDLGSAFDDACYEHGWIMIDYAWPEWTRSEEARKFLEDMKRIENASMDQLTKLLTVFCRAERFNEGSFEIALKEGWILHIVRRINHLLSESQQSSFIPENVAPAKDSK